jgi:transcriptional regulator GlxA family with amidase domain
VRASQLNDVVLHCFTFSPELLCGFFSLAEQHVFRNGNAEPVQFLPSTHPLTRRLSELVATREHDPELVQRAELLGVVAVFFSHGSFHPTAPDLRSSSAQHRFQQIICQMPDLEIIHHSPEELAQLCGCSSRHFNRLFRKHFGESARTRQTELRLAKARQLLSCSGEKIHHIALDSGYRSMSLFSSLFKRRYGMSPSEWRLVSSRQSQPQPAQQF